MSPSPQETIDIGANLLARILDSFDEIQNVRLLVIGARLAIVNIDGAEDRDKWAVDKVLENAETQLDVVIEAMCKANNLDMEALSRRLRGGANAGNS